MQGPVTVVRFGKEPKEMKALFPWWIEWPKPAGEGPGGVAVPGENRGGGDNMAIPWLSPSVLRQVRPKTCGRREHGVGYAGTEGRRQRGYYKRESLRQGKLRG